MTPAAPVASCLPVDLSCQFNSFFAGVAVGAIRPLVSLVGQTALTTADFTTSPGVQGIWELVLGVTDALFLLVILAGGGLLMGYHTYQSSYTIKEVAPRLVIAMTASNGSLLLVSRGIGVSNGVSLALSGGAVPGDAVSQLTQMLESGATGGGIAVLLLVLAALVLAVIIAIAYVIRSMAVVLLIAIAPLSLSGYALPYTAWAPRWWWRALGAALLIPPAQALTENAALHIFFAPGWSGAIASSAVASAVRPATAAPAASTDHLTNVLTALCLLYIMARIPFWLSRSVLQPFGRSPIRSLVRFAFGAAVLSRFGRALRPTRTADSSPRPGRGGSGGRARGPTGAGGGPSGTPRSAGSTPSRARTRGSPAPRSPRPTGNGTGTSTGGAAHGETPPRPSGSYGAARHAPTPPPPARPVRPRPAPRSPGQPDGARAERSRTSPPPTGSARHGPAPMPLSPAAAPGTPSRRQRTTPLPPAPGRQQADQPIARRAQPPAPARRPRQAPT